MFGMREKWTIESDEDIFRDEAAPKGKEPEVKEPKPRPKKILNTPDNVDNVDNLNVIHKNPFAEAKEKAATRKAEKRAEKAERKKKKEREKEKKLQEKEDAIPPDKTQYLTAIEWFEMLSLTAIPVIGFIVLLIISVWPVKSGKGKDRQEYARGRLTQKVFLYGILIAGGYIAYIKLYPYAMDFLDKLEAL